MDDAGVAAARSLYDDVDHPHVRFQRHDDLVAARRDRPGGDALG
jgi:hypothetical protein